MKILHVCSQVRQTSQLKHLDITGESQKEFLRLQEDKRHLQEQVEVCCGLLLNQLFLGYEKILMKDWPSVQTLGVRKEE